MWRAFPSSEYYYLIRLPVHCFHILSFYDCLQITLPKIAWFSQVPDSSICYHAMTVDTGNHYCTRLFAQQYIAFQYMNTVSSPNIVNFRCSIPSLALRPNNSHLPASYNQILFCMWYRC